MRVENAEQLKAALADGVEEIDIAAGRYEGPFELGARTVLRGAGSEVVVLVGGLTAPEGASIELADLRVDAGIAYGLKLEKGVLAIRDCVLTGEPNVEPGNDRMEVVWLIGGECVIEDSTMEGGQQTLGLSKGAKAQVRDSTLSGGWPTVFAITRSQVELDRCTVTGGGGAAVFGRGRAKVTARDCNLRGGRRGEVIAYFDKQARGLLERCDIRKGKGAGAACLDGADLKLVDCTVVDCDKKSRKRHDVWVRDTGKLTLEGCTIGRTPLGVLKGPLTPEAATELLKAALMKKLPIVVRIALAAGADVDAVTEDGRPVLVAMLDMPYLDISDAWIRRLVLKKVDVNVRDAKGRTAAFFTADDDTMAAMDKAGLDLSVVAEGGVRPVHHISSQDVGHYRLPHLLKKSKGSVRVRDDEGRTPLHYAAAGGGRYTAEQLLDAGADIFAKDKSGKTPVDLAKGEARAFIKRRAKARLKLLAKAGGTPDLSMVLMELPKRDAEGATECPFDLPEALVPWWEAIASAEVLGRDDAPIQFWGAARVAAYEHPPGLIAAGDDGLGRVLWLVSWPVAGLEVPTLVLERERVGELDREALTALAVVELADWMAISARKKPRSDVERAVARDPQGIGEATRAGALEPLRRWHPDKTLAIEDYVGTYLDKMRRSVRMLPEQPSAVLLDRAALSEALGFDEDQSWEPVIWAYLEATRGLTGLGGPFKLLAGGSDPSDWYVEEGWWRIGGETFGHEVWINPEHGGCSVLHHDSLAERGFDFDTFESTQIDLDIVVALELCLGRIENDSPEDTLLALSEALGVTVAKAADRVRWDSGLLFLYNEVSDLIEDKKVLRALQRRKKR